MNVIRFARKSSIHLAALALFVLSADLILSPSDVRAQQPATLEEGTKPFGSYQGNSAESVTVSNGKLALHIPLVSLPQRGKLDVSFSLVYHNNVYTQTACTTPKTGCETFVNADVVGVQAVFDRNYVIPYTNTVGANNLAFNSYAISEPDGSNHSLGYTGADYRTVDGSGFMYIPYSKTPYEAAPSNSSTNVAGTIVDGNGTQYVIASGSGGNNSITDVDGNYISIASTSITDTLGRTISYPPTRATTTSTVGCPSINAPLQTLVGSATWLVPGYGGSQTYLFCYANVYVSSGESSPAGSRNMTVQYNYTAPMLQSIVRPDGAYWGFVYDAANSSIASSTGYGDLIELIYPEGGTINYTWTFNKQASCLLSAFLGPGPRAIQTRTVNSNAVSGQWNYAYTSTAEGNTITTVKDPNGNQIVYTFQDFSNGYCSLYETQRQYNQQSGGGLSTVKTVTTQYQSVAGYSSGSNAAAFPTQVTTTWADGSSSYSTYAYDSGVSYTYVGSLWCSTCSTTPIYQSGGTASGPIGKVILRSDFDYSGKLLKRTQTSYLWQTNNAYLTANLLETPSSITVYGSSGTQLAQTLYAYDQSGMVGISPQQSITTQTGPPLSSIYGHATTIAQWLNTGSASPSTSTYWLNTGEVDHSIDPNRNTTSYVYSSAYDGAYPTQMTNAKGQTSNVVYDFDTGLKTSAKDANSQTTSYAYDALNRITLIARPDGGRSTFTYNQNSISANVLMCNGSAGCSSEKLTLYDGLGRPSEIETLSDASGTDYSVANYDVFGRIASMTNPYRTTSDSTYGYSSYHYDMLDRMTSLTHSPDGSSQIWTYSGNKVIFVDEAGNQWQRTFDALGRLTTVLESNGASTSLTMETDYSYDGLGNLLSVTQWGGSSGSTGARTRTFNYDSLSRLLCASNPENSTAACPSSSTGAYVSGTAGYTYDANGNVRTKTDARGVTITYNYDTLNRLLSKSYSDGTTPYSCYQYDAPTTVNAIGRLSAEWTVPGSQSGGCVGTAPTNGFITMRQTMAYDAMGRVRSEQQCTPNASGPGNCTSSSPNPFTLSYQYDLAGNTTAYTNGVSNVPGVGSIAFGLQYDGVGRLQNLSSSWNPTTGSSGSPLSLFTANPANGYTAPGAIQNIFLGNNIFVNKTYDSRLRTTAQTATHP